MIGLESPDTDVVAPPPTAVTTYPVMSDPLAGGAPKLTVSTPFPEATPTLPGASGTPAGTTEFDGADSPPDPRALAALTTN